MFVYQSGFASPCVLCNEETFRAVTGNPTLKASIEAARACLAKGDTKGYDAIKRRLPAFCFMATFDKNRGKSGTRPENTWRLQSAARLNGLVMLDFDHLGEDPRKVFSRIPSHFLDDGSRFQILYAAVTCSNDGLRLVCIADEKCGNLADNQAAMSLAFGLTCDKSIKNADRMSFANCKDDIIYIDNQLFTYHNENYDKMFGDLYRRGNSRAAQQAQLPTPVRDRLSPNPSLVGRGGDTSEAESTGMQGNCPPPYKGGAGGESAAGKITDPTPAPPLEGRGVAAPVTLERDSEGDFSYNGDKFKTIIDRWLKENGVPSVGSRHLSALKLAADLRYFCDNNAENIKAVIGLAPFVQDIIKERGQKEIDDICKDVVERKMNINMPKKLQGIASTSSATVAAAADEQRLMEKYAEFWHRLEPLMTEIYDLPTYRMEDYNKLGGVFIAGAMYCTLLTRCWYRHYDGEEQRMNPQVYIIGDPASGKGEAEKMDQIIMAPVIVADKPGRDAEREYKRQSKERSTSTKAQKGEALKRPEWPIRYLPSKTSNAVFYRRQLNAVEVINGVKYPLHLYTFDSELDSNTAAQSSGNWIGKHDIELKAFHNEFTGVDFANQDSVNDLLQIFYNSVCTGTPLSLKRKVNIRNVNDGLCSRLAMFRMVSQHFTMIKKGNRNLIHEKRCKLKEWAFKFDKISGEMPLRKLVDHIYKLCEDEAYNAGLDNDKVLDYLRKRAVFYATWFTVPRIMERAVHDAEQEKYPDVCAKMKVIKSDLDFATLIYDAVLFWQDYYFGRMLQDSWDQAAVETRPRKYKSKNDEIFANLPKVFGIKELAAQLQLSESGARQQCKRWFDAAYVKRKRNGLYEKIVSQIDA